MSYYFLDRTGREAVATAGWKRFEPGATPEWRTAATSAGSI